MGAPHSSTGSSQCGEMMLHMLVPLLFHSSPLYCSGAPADITHIRYRSEVEGSLSVCLWFGCQTLSHSRLIFMMESNNLNQQGVLGSLRTSLWSMVTLIDANMPIRDVGRFIQRWRLSSIVLRSGLKFRMTNWTCWFLNGWYNQTRERESSGVWTATPLWFSRWEKGGFIICFKANLRVCIICLDLCDVNLLMDSCSKYPLLCPFVFLLLLL